ncbi:MAG: hypothetical protein SCM96_00395 [Acidobacteriota bacterium]|nr:hypothetical protein [Acidobacteriota bacterium]
MTEHTVVDWLRENGPATGARLIESLRCAPLPLWRICRRSDRIRMMSVARRFLRLDRAVEGFARLSPSIRREFLTYTILGLEEHGSRPAEAAAELRRETATVSREKIALARRVAAEVFIESGAADLLTDRACFFIAGDVVYDMGHRVKRPERSTGGMVRGSDLDMVAVVESDLPSSVVAALDKAIYHKKHYLLVHPDYREEIDYLIKTLDRVRIQAAFDVFESQVACKIMVEGRFLHGRLSLFEKIKSILQDRGIPDLLARLETRAVASRHEAENGLLKMTDSDTDEAYQHLFFTREEGEEIY